MASPRPHGFYVVGLGAVGLGLARALTHAGWSLCGACNRDAARRQGAASELGIEVAAEPGPPLSDAELILVCVSDDAIGATGAVLAASGHVRPGTVVSHTSGLLAGSALGSIPGAHVGSLHPLVAVPAGADGAEALRNSSMAIEGDPPALALLSDVVDALGGRAFSVPAENKPRYHAAAVTASNLMVALLGEAVDVARQAQVERPLELMVELAAGAVARVGEAGATDALTGPLLRGDIATVRHHLQVLAPSARAVYVAVSLQALQRARQRGLAPELAQQLEALLRSTS